MAFVLVVVDLLKAIAWPFVVLFLALRYRDDIVTHVFPRLRKAGPTGIELDPTVEQQKTEPDLVGKSAELEKAKLIPPTPAVAQIEDRLRDALQLIDESSRQPLLVRELAVARLVIAFEHIYRAIFGSQLLGMIRLRDAYSVPLSEAREFFEGYKAQTPDAYPMGFEGWLGFLKQQELVRETADRVELTERGRDFLFFVLGNRLPLNKPL